MNRQKVVTKSYFILLIGLITSVFGASEAAAFSYGVCGNGILERAPKADDIFFQEQCDDGLLNGTEASGCTWDCMVKQDILGNGYIEPQRFEECDTGVVGGADGCSEDGKIINKFRYPDNLTTQVCGDGIIQASEHCDDGNHVNGDGCSSVCVIESGYSCDKKSLCGNGRVDYNLGEQCDEGSKNGSSTSGCTAQCLLADTPQFKLDKERVLFWKRGPGLLPSAAASENVMDGENVGRKAVQKDAGSDDQIGSLPLDPGDVNVNGTVEVSDFNQKIKIPRQGGKQFSGIFLSGVDISSNKMETYPDGKVKIHMVLRHPNKALRWDDDTIGLAFGVNKDSAADNNKASYWLLSWRSKQVYGGNYTQFKTQDCGDEAVKAAPEGLHLYRIKGTPSYNELWQMQECKRKRDNPEANIFQYPLEQTALAWKKDLKNTTPAYAWNKITNPTYLLSTFYVSDLNIEPAENEVLQLNAEFSDTEFKVWVNYQLVMHIVKPASPPSDPVGQDLYDNWPKAGEWGFYILGMDNIEADFRGLRSHVVLPPGSSTQPAMPNKISEKSSVCRQIGKNCTYKECKTPGTEPCNDECRLTKKGDELCAYNEQNKWVCYSAKIDYPTNGGGVSQMPTVSGTFEGNPGAIWVTVKNKKTGDVVCTSRAKMSEGDSVETVGAWSLKIAPTTPGCEGRVLKDGEEYTITTSAVPKKHAPLAANNPKEIQTDGPVSFNVGQDTPYLTVDKPAGNLVAVKHKDTKLLNISGTATPGSTVEVILNGKPVKKTVSSSDGTWTVTLDTSNKDKGKYKLEIKATKDGKETTIEKDLIVDQTDKDHSTKEQETTISNINSNGLYVENIDHTLTVHGKVVDKGESTYNPPKEASDSPEYVQVEIKDKNSKSTTRVTKLNPDGTYSVDVPLPSGNGPYEVSAQSVDKAGNPLSTKDTKTNVNVKVIWPEIHVVTPPNGAVLDKKEVDGSKGLKVIGKATYNGKPADVTGMSECKLYPASGQSLICSGIKAMCASSNKCGQFSGSSDYWMCTFNGADCTTAINANIDKGPASYRVEADMEVLDHQTMTESIVTIDDRDWAPHSPNNQPEIQIFGENGRCDQQADGCTHAPGKPLKIRVKVPENSNVRATPEGYNGTEALKPGELPDKGVIKIMDETGKKVLHRLQCEFKTIDDNGQKIKVCDADVPETNGRDADGNQLPKEVKVQAHIEPHGRTFKEEKDGKIVYYPIPEDTSKKEVLSTSKNGGIAESKYKNEIPLTDPKEGVTDHPKVDEPTPTTNLTPGKAISVKLTPKDIGASNIKEGDKVTIVAKGPNGTPTSVECTFTKTNSGLVCEKGVPWPKDANKNDVPKEKLTITGTISGNDKPFDIYNGPRGDSSTNGTTDGGITCDPGSTLQGSLCVAKADASESTINVKINNLPSAVKEGDKVNIVAKGPNGEEKKTTCTVNSARTCEAKVDWPKDTKGQLVRKQDILITYDKDTVGRITPTPAPNQPGPVNVDAGGLVAGGCSTTPVDTGLIGLILGALGLGFLRRRKED